ncbi:MAG: MFS transporter [Tannerella sp.]|nr:MFS transporter [Tannerella sp.]
MERAKTVTNTKLTPLKGTSGGSSQVYIIVTAFLSLFAIVGLALYGLPFFYDFWEGDYGWSRTTITSGNALGKLLVAPLFGFIAGWLIDRYGPRKLMVTGSLMAGMAIIGLSYTDGSLTMFYLFYVFNALGYVCAGPLPCQVLISRWFDKNRGKAMGIAYLGIGAGGAFVPLLSNGIESRAGWHTALIALGVIVMLISLPMALFIREPAKANVNRNDDAAKHIENQQDADTNKILTVKESQVSIGSILRNPNFYLLCLGSMCAIGVVGGVNQHLKLYLRDFEFAQDKAAHIISLVLLSSLIGRVLMGWLADMLSRKYVMILIYLMVAAAIPLLMVPDFPGRIYLFAVIFGIGLGGDYMIIPLIAGDLFGLKALGRTMGIILVADGIAESVFPMMVGAIYDISGKSYMPAFAILIGVALAGAVIVSFLPKKVENQKSLIT